MFYRPGIMDAELTILIGRRRKFGSLAKHVSRVILIDPIYRRNILTLKKSGLPLVAGGADPATGRATQPSALLVSPSLLLVSGDSQRTGRRGTPLPLDLSLHKCGLGKHEKLVLSRNRGWDASGYKTSSWTQTDNLSSFCLSVPKDLGIFERMLRPRLTIRCICDGH
ncbi:hypothetical protein CNBA6750 [Cryptococcus deneoformans B-3501A]|uniref:hypothetical protein n=1 Tax=Cryptococcus deneoformans (strain B-3501A) TaxID=283643 RepID=UPI000042FA97|nr:hypothetical protein CNBA6750 [Cryptococcus neoformans var. neoformans B-3501A]EAL22906.1 hypothetical protein CNBA6750 [Cryptococcus neoformans var. neoformans B-3501A]